MRIHEAKDFLVQQTTEQAALDGVSFSDLERRMMYFTEGKSATEDPVSLNEEFEQQYDSNRYERKVSGLMKRALRRLKKEAPEKAVTWKKAIQTLQRGDHYLLVLADAGVAHAIPHLWRLILFISLPIVLFYVFMFLYSGGGRAGGGRTPYLHYLPLLGPHALRVMQMLFLALLISAIFFPRIFEPVAKYVGYCFDYLLGADEKESSKEK